MVKLKTRLLAYAVRAVQGVVYLLLSRVPSCCSACSQPWHAALGSSKHDLHLHEAGEGKAKGLAPATQVLLVLRDVGRGVCNCWERVVRKGTKELWPFLFQLLKAVCISWKSALAVFTSNRSVKLNTLVYFQEFQGNDFKERQRQCFEDVSVSSGERLALLCFFPSI